MNHKAKKIRHPLTRFGCHRFLNSRPFSDYLFEYRQDFGIEVRFDHPARLADALKEGALDLALIPSIEYLNFPDGRIIPDMSISSSGVVKTVLLVCRTKLEEVKSIALDERSRTSVVLLKLILKDKGVCPESFMPMAPDIQAMLKRSDAALVIGDAAFGLDGYGVEIYDLSSEWFRMTRKPFVHAIIVASPHAHISSNLMEGIRRAKRVDQGRIRRIAEEESLKLNISVEECVDYLTNKIICNLGPKEIEGLNEFYAMAVENKLIDPKSKALRFLEAG